MPQKLVLMDHDGAIDDFLALMLMLTMDEVELLGVVVTPADCYIDAATSVTQKILRLVDRTTIPIAKSTVRGINPFPADFRRDCLIVDNLPILNESEDDLPAVSTQSGRELIIETLQNAPQPVTLMMTGPLTTVAEAIALQPQISDNIAEIVWMGGALEVPGNVQTAFAHEQDGTAEWNVFWDYLAAKQIWETEVDVTLCPLDLTNNVPVISEFICKLAKQRQYPLSDLAGLCYALAMTQDYYFWDVLATAYLARPKLYQIEERETDIITTGASQGRTILKAGGRKVKVMTQVDKEKFYSYLLQQFAR